MALERRFGQQDGAKIALERRLGRLGTAKLALERRFGHPGGDNLAILGVNLALLGANSAAMGTNLAVLGVNLRDSQQIAKTLIFNRFFQLFRNVEASLGPQVGPGTAFWEH